MIKENNINQNPYNYTYLHTDAIEIAQVQSKIQKVRLVSFIQFTVAKLVLVVQLVLYLVVDHSCAGRFLLDRNVHALVLALEIHVSHVLLSTIWQSSAAPPVHL